MTKHTDASRSDDLVERLRERTSYSEILLCHPPRPAPDRLCHEAADRIEALEAENMMLREERDRLIKFVNIMCEEYGLEYDGVVKQ